METSAFILDMLNRLQRAVAAGVDGLTPEELAWRPGPEANPIGFILWHQARAEDAFVQGMIRKKPVIWVSRKWHQKLNLPENPADSGYGYTAEQVGAFPVPKLDDLLGYAAAVRSQTVEYLENITPDKLDEVVPTPFGELTIGQILAALLCEITLHAGQIAYLRGLQKGLNK